MQYCYTCEKEASLKDLFMSNLMSLPPRIYILSERLELSFVSSWKETLSALLPLLLRLLLLLPVHEFPPAVEQVVPLFHRDYHRLRITIFRQWHTHIHGPCIM